MATETALAVLSFSDIKSMSEVLGKNKMFGKSAEDLLPLMLIAQAEGIHPALAAQEYDIIQGRPALNAKSVQARFQRVGGIVRWDVRTDNEATVTVAHPQGGELKITWTLERAKRAGLAGKEMYTKFPQQMLASRAISEAVRACLPSCLSGMYSRAEIEDSDIGFETAPSAPRNVTPEKPQKGTSAADLSATLETKPEPEPVAVPGETGLF